MLPLIFYDIWWVIPLTMDAGNKKNRQLDIFRTVMDWEVFVLIRKVMSIIGFSKPAEMHRAMLTEKPRSLITVLTLQGQGLYSTLQVLSATRGGTRAYPKEAA